MPLLAVACIFLSCASSLAASAVASLNSLLVKSTFAANCLYELANAFVPAIDFCAFTDWFFKSDNNFFVELLVIKVVSFNLFKLPVKPRSFSTPVVFINNSNSVGFLAAIISYPSA